MSNELESHINEEVFKDKVFKFYNHYKITIISLILLLITGPIILQIYFFYDEAEKQKLLSNYLKAEIIFKDKNQNQEQIKILENLILKNNETVRSLSLGKLVDYYVENNNHTKAYDYANNKNIIYEKSIFSEINDIRKVILKFDSIKENEILDLLKNNKNNNFPLIKKKLLNDFYIKNNQKRKSSKLMQN